MLLEGGIDLERGLLGEGAPDSAYHWCVLNGSVSEVVSAFLRPFSWLEGKPSLNYDVSAWPANKGCSHLKSDMFPDKDPENPFDTMLKPPPKQNDDVDVIDDL